MVNEQLDQDLEETSSENGEFDKIFPQCGSPTRIEIQCVHTQPPEAADSIDRAQCIRTEHPVRPSHSHSPKFAQIFSVSTDSNAPKVELKPLPPNLRYEYLGEDATYPLIVNSELNKEQTEKLLHELRLHRKAIDYTIDDASDCNGG